MVFSATEPASGIQSIQYLLDGSTTPVQFEDPLDLALGTHTLLYYAISNAGIQESTRTAHIIVSSQAFADSRAIASKADGEIFEVLDSGSSRHLARFTSQGMLISSAALPGGQAGEWSIAINGNDIFVVGSGDSSSLVYRFNQYAVLQASASTAGHLLTAKYFDSALWSTGALQDAGDYELGLWKYDPSSNLISLTTTYASGAGVDIGADLARDDSGDIWAIGFSSNAQIAAPERLMAPKLIFLRRVLFAFS